jgi:adenine deaminase
MPRSSWQAQRAGLIDVAMGRRPADTVVQRGQWVAVQSGEIISNTDIAILDGRIAYIGASADFAIGPQTEIIAAQGRFMAPGLLDAHMHVESGMITVAEFVRAVAPRGTTGMFIDPHEIANVFGLPGVKLMVDEAQQMPIHVWVQMPSCVPSAPGLETPGALIGPEEVAEAMQWPGIIGLGEMMNFPGVYNSDEKMLAEMAETAVVGKTIGGHFASPNLAQTFHAYVAGGAEDDHEGTRKEDAIARARQGMKVMMRLGSAWHDVREQVRAVTEDGLDPRNFILCTDDSHSGTLIHDGHMDRVVRHAIECGLDPVIALQMATINTAEHFGVDRDMGQLAPGRYADIVLLENLEEMQIDLVIAKGDLIAKDGNFLAELPEFQYPDWAKQSVNLGKKYVSNDFLLASDGLEDPIAHVIGVIENQAPTKHLRLKVRSENGRIPVDMEQDIAMIALVERHAGTGKAQVGLVQGFGLKAGCALASTVAHDSHHMIVVGTDEADMAIAANELGKIGGGQIVVQEGKVIGLVELPIAGLMSDERAEIVAEKADALLAAYQACGCKLNNPNMQLSLLALVVIPELRISDKGLVDVEKFQITKVLERDDTNIEGTEIEEVTKA